MCYRQTDVQPIAITCVSLLTHVKNFQLLTVNFPEFIYAFIFTPSYKVWSLWVTWLKSLFGSHTQTDMQTNRHLCIRLTEEADVCLCDVV